MQKTLSDSILGIKFNYFTNDCMAGGSVGSNKEWEPHITEFTRILNSFTKLDGIIDIGANFGYHTLLFSRTCSQVHAFEPQIQNFNLLQDNVILNNIGNITTYNYACGDENCEIKMPIFNCGQDQKVNMGDITPNILMTDNHSVTRSIILDELKFTEKIQLIKIDVQGWEKKVLIGANKMLQTHKPVLIVEFEHFQLEKTQTTCKELFDYIRGQNYYIFYLDYEYPSDHICVHNDNLEDFKSKFKDYIFPHFENNAINNNVMNGVCEKITMFNKSSH